MLATKAAADEARLALARNLTALEGRKRYAFLEALVSVRAAGAPAFASPRRVACL
jgi:hypothetical protein